MLEITIFLIILTLLLLASAYFASSEAALFSLPHTKIKAYQYDADPKKQLIASLVVKHRDLLVTIFMLNTLVNILLQNVASSMFGSEASWVQKVGLPLIVTLIFGEIIPKYYGLEYNVALSYLFAPSINFLQTILKPLRKFIIKVTAPVSRILFFFLKKDEEISPEELQHVLKTSQAHGVLTQEEGLLVSGYLDLHDSSIKELMWPREDMLCYEINEPITKLTHLFSEKKKSHIPIYEKDLDNILGIISAKNYFIHHDQIEKKEDLIKLTSRPFYIPENAIAKPIFRKMQEQGQMISIVVNEYGSIVGLISLDDLIEVVIGKTTDEEGVNALYTISGENEIIASGKLDISVINELFNVELTSESNMVTIGGWLTEMLGDIPKSGQKYQTDELFFHVLSAHPNRVRRVYIRKKRQKGKKP